MRLVSVVFGGNTIGNGDALKDKKFYLKKRIVMVGVIVWNLHPWRCSKSNQTKS